MIANRADCHHGTPAPRHSFSVQRCEIKRFADGFPHGIDKGLMRYGLCRISLRSKSQT